jgi:hypothetical protein
MFKTLEHAFNEAKQSTHLGFNSRRLHHPPPGTWVTGHGWQAISFGPHVLHIYYRKCNSARRILPGHTDDLKRRVAEHKFLPFSEQR